MDEPICMAGIEMQTQRTDSERRGRVKGRAALDLYNYHL